MLINKLISKIIKSRIPQIEAFMNNPLEIQDEVLKNLISSSKNTVWGKFYDYKSINDWDTFNQRMPLNSYEALMPFFERMRMGETNVLWEGNIKWFSKSSGTTSNKSKFIPVSEESLKDCHYKGGTDMLAIYVNNNNDTKIFTGSSLALGGSKQENEYNNDIFVGDISAIIIDNLPFWAEFYRTPNKEIALMPEWEQKLDSMIKKVSETNVTSLSGVPSWMLVLLKGMVQYTGRDIRDIWTNLEVYFHGGVSFEPYREQFNSILQKDINYMETYNASEGFFGLQDRKNDNSMLLLLDYGIYYEFIPFEEIDKEIPKIINLSQVEKNKNYAMVISTNGGLWRYLIGDTIIFTDIKPYRFKITGRTKNFINLCGEEVIVDNSNRAIETACKATDAIINEYTAAPFNQDIQCHQWICEFNKMPSDKEKFTEILDKTLQELNSDYEAKRHKDLVLKMPKVHLVAEGTFYKWLKQRGKLGGQHKVPRLSNSREYIDEILQLIE